MTIPAELARKGITGARHTIPAGQELNVARDLVLVFGEEIRAHLAGFRPQATGAVALTAGKPAEVLSCPGPSKVPSI